VEHKDGTGTAAAAAAAALQAAGDNDDSPETLADLAAETEADGRN
jgi:hypothetical protein